MLIKFCYKIKFLKIKILWRIRACDIIGILVSIMTLHIYVTNNEPWIVMIMNYFLAEQSSNFIFGRNINQNVQNNKSLKCCLLFRSLHHNGYCFFNLCKFLYPL